MPPTPDSDFIALQTALAGEYSLHRELGRGRMRVVYLAREVRLARRVAIKVLPPALSSNPDLRAAFLRETPSRRMITEIAIDDIVDADTHIDGIPAARG